MKQYYVYILTSQRNGTIYVGMTNNLERRVREHKLGEIEGFTKKYGINRLVYFEEYSSNQEAFFRERRLKKWKREWKLRLIENENSLWRDLAEDWD